MALKLFRRHGGVLRTRDALELGIHPRTLYQLRDSAALDQVSRGVYRLASLPDLGEPDLVTLALRVPKAVICLISALAYHEINGHPSRGANRPPTGNSHSAGRVSANPGVPVHR